jgi:RNA recognition motif-containing protein
LVGKPSKTTATSDKNNDNDDDDAAGAAVRRETTKLFVRNLPRDVDEAALEAYFGKFGPVKRVILIMKKVCRLVIVG